ncbi:MAG: hypothetical protein U0794_03420 [Isosphaeraceae bacterium]
MNLFFTEAANDRLTLNGQGGSDVINATSLEADGVKPGSTAASATM